MTYRFKLTDIFKFKDYSVFPVRSNRVEQIVMEIVRVSSLMFVNSFSLSLLTMWFCGESIT